MRARLIRLAMALYPAKVRDRYGAELGPTVARHCRYRPVRTDRADRDIDVDPQHHPVAPVLTLPTSLTAGILAIANLPIVGDMLGDTRSATVLSTLCWCAATLTLGIAITVLIRQGHTGIAAAILVIGGLVTLELTSALYASAARPIAADGVSAFSVWPLSVGGFADPSRISTSAPGSLPAILTMCTTYALARAAASAAHQRKTDLLRSQKPAARSHT